MRRTSPTSKFALFFKANWVQLLLALLFFLFVFPWIYRKAQDAISSFKQNKQDNATDELKNQIDNAIKVNSAENSTANPVTRTQKQTAVAKKYKSKRLSKAKMRELANISENIAIAFGTNAEENGSLLGVDFFGDVPKTFSAMTEDEKEAIKQLKKVPGTFGIVADYYYNVYTRSRNLKTDIKRFLTTSQIQELRDHYKKYGIRNVI
ncbi:hypothetical protein SAMN05444377_10489 [Flavobacterium fontis]|uniref:Uncharacterized protein n=1 Tax=Flavobacterium fontis TaxID=1124188 RepID=A0A1M4ZAA3_9FLAO|nr:hypothetical protein [Flavobacterium fontis]SHF14158.1 hypothetical protein SAMN05444377_10477 [Flavobacterium fontis]SHF14506.1 hypothetical protein SAMN05444377_10489 [Flavobacterium fontis]